MILYLYVYTYIRIYMYVSSVRYAILSTNALPLPSPDLCSIPWYGTLCSHTRYICLSRSELALSQGGCSATPSASVCVCVSLSVSLTYAHGNTIRARRPLTLVVYAYLCLTKPSKKLLLRWPMCRALGVLHVHILLCPCQPPPLPYPFPFSYPRGTLMTTMCKLYYSAMCIKHLTLSP